jgi:nicotinamide mononucleotide transporter
MLEIVKNWVTNNYFELFGTVASLIYIFFSVKQSIWLWPIGFVSSVVSAVVFFQSTLYADMGLQMYYIVISVYGWIYWKTKKQEASGQHIKFTTLTIKNWIITVISIALIGICLYYPMAKYTKATNPLFDGLITSASIVATWMLARKIIDQWLIWIVANGASIILFAIKHLYLFSFLSMVYTIMSVIGYIKWKKDWANQRI